MDLYIASTNRGKLADFRFAAEQWSDVVAIHVLPGLEGMPEPVEDAPSFEGNARLKAEFYSARVAGIWVLCDDSGLEVDALEGRPGVRSARFSRDLGSYNIEAGVDSSNNTALVLAMLEQTDRRARYRCVLALAKDGAVHRTASGTLEGEVLNEPEGSGGFGYDPLFFVPQLGRTMAQALPEERLRLSHRGLALYNLLEGLRSDPLNFGHLP